MSTKTDCGRYFLTITHMTPVDRPWIRLHYGLLLGLS